MAAPSHLHHVGIVVDDLDKAIGFYQETLGLHLESRTEIVERGLRLAFLGGPGGRVELLEYFGAQLGKKPAGLVDHVALAVGHLDPVVTALAQAGVSERDAAPRPGPGGNRIYFFRGPAGERIELVEVGA